MDSGEELGERRRRMDRVTAPDFLDGLADRPLDEVRAMRDDCRDEEPALSYARRLAQGQMDIARAEQRRREAGGGGDLVEHLKKVLSDDPAPRRAASDAHVAPVFDPERSPYGSRSHDTLVDDPAMSRLPDLDASELEAVIVRLEDKEREVSRLRRIVLHHLDALQAEVVRRYAASGSAIDDVVASVVPPERGPERP